MGRGRKTIGRFFLFAFFILPLLNCGGVGAPAISENPSEEEESTTNNNQGVVIKGTVSSSTLSSLSVGDSALSSSTLGEIICKSYDGTILDIGVINILREIEGVVIPLELLTSAQQIVCEVIFHDGQKFLNHYDLRSCSAGAVISSEINAATTLAVQQVITHCGDAVTFDNLWNCDAKIKRGNIDPSILYEQYLRGERRDERDSREDGDENKDKNRDQDRDRNHNDNDDGDSDDDNQETGDDGEGDADTVTTPPPPAVVATINTNGLVAYYPFSGNAKDESSYGNHGIVSGANLTNDRLGNANSAYHFYNSSIDIPASPSLSMHNAVSIVAWVMNDIQDQCQDIVNGDGIYRISAWWGNPHGYAFELMDPKQHIVHEHMGFVANYSLIPVLNQWNHIAATWDGTTMKIYRNGVLMGSADYSGTLSSLQGIVRIGMHHWQPICRFLGAIDEVFIFNRALSAAEVNGLYSGDAYPTLEMTIDIKPGSAENSLNPENEGVIPVGILSTQGFSVPEKIDQSSLRFGRTGSEIGGPHSCRVEDVNSDQLLDLICHFVTSSTQLRAGDAQGVLKGNATSGLSITGYDTISIVP